MDTATDRSVEPFQETVICSDEAGQKAHRELFSMPEGRYRVSGEGLLDSIEEALRGPNQRLHVALPWESMLRVALWTRGRPVWFDVCSLLRKAGLSDAELAPYAKADLNDLFPWLYYGKRLDVLRRVCNSAKTRIESRSGGRRIQVYCHLVSGEQPKIVASSL